MQPADQVPVSVGAARWGRFGLGWVCVGLGGVGILLPGLPGTAFFVLAASCFARSSPRFERWLLGLPGVGPLVRDHRAGLGMSRRNKAMAMTTMLAVAVASVLVVGSTTARALVGVTTAVGAAYLLLLVPTQRLAEATVLASQPVAPATSSRDDRSVK